MGTRVFRCKVCCLNQDHPHAYGDKSPSSSISSTSLGSSPRVWGQAGIDYLEGVTTRIIPTRMGTRRGTSSTTTGVKDHPHAYGDKFISTDFRCYAVGSSPRVWGQVTEYRQKAIPPRIIPTRMGTS